MLSRRLSVGLAVGASCCTLVAGLAACSSNSSNSSSGGNNGGGGGSGGGQCNGNLAIAFDPGYSAYIPGSTHTFKLPAVAAGATGKVTWAASDPSAVGFQDYQVPSNLPATMMTMLKAADPVTITATDASGNCGSAQLHIESATDDDWQAGNTRYNNGIALVYPSFDGGRGAAPPPDAGSIFEQDGGGPACTSCHGTTATNGLFRDVDHTPQQTGGFSDQDLVNIVVNGEVPDGGYFDPTIVNYYFWQYFHRWSDINTPQLQKGVIVYLRSLEPSAQQGHVDFGGFRSGDGGGGGGGGGGGSGDDGGGSATSGSSDAGAE